MLMNVVTGGYHWAGYLLGRIASRCDIFYFQPKLAENRLNQLMTLGGDVAHEVARELVIYLWKKSRERRQHCEEYSCDSKAQCILEKTAAHIAKRQCGE